jgi:hypothetical protein
MVFFNLIGYNRRRQTSALRIIEACPKLALRVLPTVKEKGNIK